ncbi:shikimate kinase, partial [Trichloromonas sp.]|uniref:shikimate kinase n=1 Tax=Trichloromonas sp. TaxID=3069249 RepID=UPI003D815B48
LKLDVDRHVIATGGSAVYSEKGMTHLKRISTIVFLEVDYAEIKRRIRNFDTRGIARAKGQSFRQLFEERQALYRRYAEIRVDGNRLSQEELAEEIAAAYLRS